MAKINGTCRRNLQSTPKFTQVRAICISRCAVSVPSNIAEGQKRLSNKETVQFTSIALGSLAELQTQLILCNKLYGIGTDVLVDECEQITKMLATLVKSLRARL